MAKPSGEASRYAHSGHHYTPGEMTAKERVVIEILDHARPREVLDVGCNSGHFSALAARIGARVVAIDRDPEAAGALWRMAAADDLDVLPLVIDIAWPPGARGWANGESQAFLDRARGRFDCLLMLALIHHLLIAVRAPLDCIFELVSQLTRRDAIVEYVDPADAQFRTIARGRDALHADLTPEAFERAAGRWFAIRGSWPITPTRRIYWFQKGA